MAQKYDLLTVPTVNKSPAKFQPWYKERLDLKFSKTCGLRSSLRGDGWVFIRDDVDDWRNGNPAAVSSEELVIRRKSNLLPVLSSQTARPKRVKRREIVRNGKTATLYSKVGAQQQMAKRRIDNVEKSLTNHPLALYPHLEKSMPMEMFDDVVELLDPEMNPTGSEGDVGTPPDSPPATDKQDTGSEDLKSADSNADEMAASQQAIYQWPMIGIKEESNEDHTRPGSTEVTSASPEGRVEQVTKDLCKWMKDLNVDGGATLDEENIRELFTNDYETNRNWSVPVRVVELTTIPLELRGASAQYSRSVSAQSHRLQSASSAFMIPRSLEELPQRCVRTRYGAWYLPKSLWKPMLWNEPLRDPNEETKEATTEIKLEFGADLADTHAVRSFAEYVERRRTGGCHKSMYARSSIPVHSKPSISVNRPSIVCANQ